MTDPASPPTASFKNTSTSLMVFGVGEILLGSLCALFIPLILMSQTMASKMQTPPEMPPFQQIVPSLFIYALLAGFFVAVGYGSICGRRWARALMLITSWIWLICGILGVMLMYFMMPIIFEATSAAAKQHGGQAPGPEALAFMRLVAVGFASVIYVIIPGTFVTYYMSKNVKATCEWKNPQLCWTDRCPLPVLGLSLFMGIGAAMFPLTMVMSKSAIPLFGVILSGMTGSIFILLSAAIHGYLGWGLFKLKPFAWKLTMGVAVFYAASSIVTFMRLELVKFYRQAGMQESQLEIFRRMNLFSSHSAIVVVIFTSLAYVSFLMFIRKYFPTPISNDPKI